MPNAANPVFTPEYDELRRVLVEKREAAGLTQSELGARIGRSGPHITLLERGQRRVEFLEFYTLVSAMGMDPAHVAEEVFAAFRALAVHEQACAKR